MKNEYEIIKHNDTNFHIFLVNMLYRTPHMHMDFEILTIINGMMSVLSSGIQTVLHTGDICILNPLQMHEIKAEFPATVLSLQVPPSFFSVSCPQLEHTEFLFPFIHRSDNPDESVFIRNILTDIAYTYFDDEEWGSLKCASLIDRLFFELLKRNGHRLISEKEHIAGQSRGFRLRKILDYIDRHYSEKLTLHEISDIECLDLYYMSHLFKEQTGMPFQVYLSKIRCEHARQQLLLTNDSLLDISIENGFSDPKYFNNGFKDQYGLTPKEYRKAFGDQKTDSHAGKTLSTQEIMSDPESLSLLSSLVTR